MSGSRQPPQPHPPAGQGAAASAVTSASSSSAPGSCSSSAGLGGPARPVLVAAAVSGSGAAASGLSRLAGTARPGGSGGGSSSGGGGGGSRKRPLLTPLCNGLLNSYEDKSNDFVCPICFDMIEEAYMTKCGHSFCYKCIHQSLEDNNRCPKCNYVVDNIDHLYPNFLVNELILKQKQRFEEKRFKLDHSNGHRWQIFQDLMGTDQDNLDLANVNLMLELLVQKKKQLEAESHAAQLQILMEFLKVARRNKRETPYHGKHGAQLDHRGSYKNCEHLAHYPAVHAAPEPAKAGDGSAVMSDEDMDTEHRPWQFGHHGGNGAGSCRGTPILGLGNKHRRVGPHSVAGLG